MLLFAIVLVFIVTFLAAGLVVLIVWFARQKVQPKTLPADLPDQADAPRLLREEKLSTITPWAAILERFDFIEIMKRQIAQADLDWSVGRVTLAMLLAGSLVLAVLWHGAWLPGWLNALLACCALLLPYLYVLRCRTRRFARFEAHFPDALDSLARALRAGHPFAAAMEVVAGEAEAPVSTELRRAVVEGNFGASWGHALDNLCSRIPLLEVNMFAAAVQLQSRTGGKLSEVLGTLAEGMRESSSLKGEVRALAAHGRLTGLVLTVLPIAIAGIMSFVNPAYLGTLYHHPYGKYLFTAAAASLITAHFVIRRIVDIKI